VEVTGSGLKDPIAVAQRFPEPTLITPKIAEFEDLLNRKHLA